MSATFERIWEELVPREGNCDTVAGEMIRATGRLRYDFYNNGMGNNTSGALKFLREKGAIDKELFDYVLPYTTGRTYSGNYENDLFPHRDRSHRRDDHQDGYLQSAVDDDGEHRRHVRLFR